MNIKALDTNKGKRFVCFVILVFSIYMMFFCLTGCGENNSLLSKFDVIDASMTTEYNEIFGGYKVEITGKANNKTSSNLEYVVIQFSLYNEDGNVIETASDSISVVEGNGTWVFKARCSCEILPTSFKLTAIDSKKDLFVLL